jgi:hypothetical protein
MENYPLKGQCDEIFCFRFFHESSSPKPLKITLGSFRIFSENFQRLFASQGAPSTRINNTGGKFATGISDTGGKFTINTAGVIGTSGKFAPVAMTPVAISHRYQLHCMVVNLPLVSTIDC